MPARLSEEAALNERVCLRCDWTGETDGVACPRCGVALYKVTEPTTPGVVTSVPRPNPQPAGDRMARSPIESIQDEIVPQAEPVAANRRWAMTVGVLAVAAVWIVARSGTSDRDQRPAVSGGAQTGSTVIFGSPEQVGASVLPPEGASPSAPERGKLVAGKEDIYVYADGRMIWGREGLPVWLEQRLTPQGVELVRSGAVRLDGQSLDPGSALPESALEDRLIKAYVPSRYAVCPGYWPWNLGSLEPASILGHLPVPAQALLRGHEQTYDASAGTRGNLPPPFTSVECFEVTTEKARALDGIFRDAGIERIDELDSSTPSQWVVYKVRATAALRQSFISMMPLLPHEEWGFSGSG